MPKTRWRHYAENRVAPICRKLNGSFTAKGDSHPTAAGYDPLLGSLSGEEHWVSRVQVPRVRDDSKSASSLYFPGTYVAPIFHHISNLYRFLYMFWLKISADPAAGPRYSLRLRIRLRAHAPTPLGRPRL